MRKSELAAELAARDLAPRKSAGQHFLVDDNVLRAIVRDARLPKESLVLEVGPGPGLLTEHLLAAGHRVVAVEIDRGLSALCRERFARASRFTLIDADVLARRKTLNPVVVEALAGKGDVHVVSNLPYNIASTVLLLLWESDLPIASTTTLVQLETAQRVIASAATEAYGHLSVLFQLLAQGKIVRRVPPQVFWPEPEVESALVRLTPRPGAPKGEEYEQVKKLAKAAFQHRRKTLISSAKGSGFGPDQLRDALSTAGLPSDVRAERVSPDTFRALARAAGQRFPGRSE